MTDSSAMNDGVLINAEWISTEPDPLAEKAVTVPESNPETQVNAR